MYCSIFGVVDYHLFVTGIEGGLNPKNCEIVSTLVKSYIEWM